MTRSSPGLARIWVFLAVFLLAAGLGAQTAVDKNSGGAPGKTSHGSSAADSYVTKVAVDAAKLAAARTALNAMENNDSLAVALEGYAVSLSAHDAVTLFLEYIPRLTGDKKVDAAFLGGSLALMLGRYGDGAFIFSQAAQENPESGLKAARAYLAAGKTKEARAVLENLHEQPAVASFQENKNILLAWLFLFEGKGEPAFVILKDMVSVSHEQDETRGQDENKASGKGAGLQSDKISVEKEALFLLWILASTHDIRSFSAPSAGYEASAMEALLIARYPHSIETAMIQRGIMPIPGAWLLGGVFPFPALVIESSASQSQPGAGSEMPEQAGSVTDNLSGDASAKLQVGWFSRKDNASSLGASLKKSGFTVSVEEQKTKDGQARWAVIVDAEADWTKTQAKLKDLGYESYLLP